MQFSQKPRVRAARMRRGLVDFKSESDLEGIEAVAYVCKDIVHRSGQKLADFESFAAINQRLDLCRASPGTL
jgi:hypothetical protein